MSVSVPEDPAIVGISADDLAACADILLENVFAHTAEGVGLAVRRQPGHARLPPASRIRCRTATAAVASPRAGHCGAALGGGPAGISGVGESRWSWTARASLDILDQ